MSDNPSIHSFHIPVLGLCFSIDTPIKVAKYGISSVISIIEDELIEDMRAYHSLKIGWNYIPIPKTEPDYRAKRITAYLNMLDAIVTRQIAVLKYMSFEDGSDLVKYFELLPEESSLKGRFLAMCALPDGSKKDELQRELRALIVAGSIDVNIMAKVDNANYTPEGEKLPDEYSDALSALRGYANSTLCSSIVFSAGYNPRLFNYIENFEDFFPDAKGSIRKKIILKVSDYRSALIQGKILAKKGLWVSEFRIESGINCGGHAFPTDGFLLGPILEEFKVNRIVLHAELLGICNNALHAKGRNNFKEQPYQKITVQGGVGTADEHRFLIDYYGVDSVGWGSPFLLVPEATNVDEHTLQQLSTAVQEDYFLSNASPLGVPFNNFRKSTSEAQRLKRIEKNRPGSPCYKKYLASNTEFTSIPICTASRKYQYLKINQTSSSGITRGNDLAEIVEKDCLCEGLTSSVRLRNQMYLPHKLSAVAICPGPNLAYFSGVFSLKEMVGHIYGRKSILNGLVRPHMFVNELKAYLDFFIGKKRSQVADLTEAQKKYFEKCKANLTNGIEYYRTIFHYMCNTCTDHELQQLELRTGYL